MIPDHVLAQLLSTPASQQMREAASDLSARLAHGEFDALDEAQRNDLMSLAQILEHWSRRVLALEGGVIPHAGQDRPQRPDS